MDPSSFTVFGLYIVMMKDHGKADPERILIMIYKDTEKSSGGRSPVGCHFQQPGQPPVGVHVVLTIASIATHFSTKLDWGGGLA